MGIDRPFATVSVLVHLVPLRLGVLVELVLGVVVAEVAFLAVERLQPLVLLPSRAGAGA